MNKKGFTLVELLAVIIILSLLTILASTSVTKVVTNSKSELYNTQISLIKAAAESWGADNLDRLPSENGECKYINLGQLKRYGVLDSSIKNPKTNKEFSDDMNIKVTSNINSYGNLILNYEVDPIDITTCTPMYEKICTLVTDADNSNSITPGDKYQCKVKDDMEEGFEDGYYFYMLSNNNDGTINLIMDRNINSDGTPATKEIPYNQKDQNNGIYSQVAWASKEDYNDDTNYGSYGTGDKGPITAMNFLNNATADWNNIPNLNLTFDDENGYFTNFSITGKARLPYYSELEYYDGTNGYLYDHLHVKCLDEEEMLGGKVVSCDVAVYIEGVYKDGIENIQGMYDYWTFSVYDDFTKIPAYASTIYWYGSFDVKQVSDHSGVRPVITIPQFNIYN